MIQERMSPEAYMIRTNKSKSGQEFLKTYPLIQQNIITRGKPFYFDHPKFGILVYIDRVEE